MDLLEQPGVFYAAAPDTLKRKLLAAYFALIWIDDDGHKVTPETHQQTAVAQITATARETAANETGTETMPGAAEISVISQFSYGACSSKDTLVRLAGFEPAAFGSATQRSIP